MRHAASWWAERVRELAASGDARSVARRHGVKEGTLLWWRSRLRRKGRPEVWSRLLPVVVSAGPVPTAAARGDELEVVVEVVVEMATSRVTIRGALTAAQLAAIVSATTQRC